MKLLLAIALCLIAYNYCQTVETYAGSSTSGGQDGPASSSTFSTPRFIYQLPGNRLAVTEPSKVRLIDLNTNQVSTIITAASNAFVEVNGRFFVIHSGNHVIHEVNADGSSPTVWCGTGTSGSGIGCNQNAFISPTHISLHNGDLLVSDTGNDRIVRINPTTKAFTIEASFSGTHTQAYGSCVHQDTMFIAGASAVYQHDLISKTTTLIAGEPDTTGSNYNNAIGTDTRFFAAANCAATQNNVYLVEATRIIRISRTAPHATQIYFGTSSGTFNNGPPFSSASGVPSGLVISGEQLYFTDITNHRIRRISDTDFEDQCDGNDIGTLTSVNKGEHNLELALGGFVKYNYTNILYNRQNITIAVVESTSAPIQLQGDACDFQNGIVSSVWADEMQPNCDREILSNIPFQNFVNCTGVSKSTVTVGGYPYDSYAGVFGIKLVTYAGNVAGVDFNRVTFIRKRFSLNLQKEITLTTRLNITQPTNIFEAAARLQTFDYATNRLLVHFFTAQTTGAQYSLDANSVSGPHTAQVFKAGSPNYPDVPARAACPAGVQNCENFLLSIDPTSGVAECSWSNQQYDTTLSIQCGGCLVQGEAVVVEHIVSLSDYCDEVALQFDLTGSFELFSDAARTTPLVGPVSIDTTVYARANIEATFAPIVNVDLNEFKICSRLSGSHVCGSVGSDNNRNIVLGNSIVSGTNGWNVSPNPISSATVTQGNSVQFDFQFDLLFLTGFIEQSHLNTVNGQLLFESQYNVQYVNKKKRSTLAGEIENEPFTMPVGLSIVPKENTDENSASMMTMSFATFIFAIVMYVF